MRAGRTLIALGAVLALGAAIYFVFEYENPVYAAPTLAAIPLAWSILQLTYRYWSKEHAGARDSESTPEQAAAAADWLADAVAASWRKEAAARRIAAPAPVSVRWGWKGDLAPREAGRRAAPGAGPSALPRDDQSDRILNSGVVTRLHDELYARLPRGRLVITGEPGSGKTGAMILLLLQALAWREGLAPEKRAKVPVPVFLPLAGWDPVAVSLPTWAASMLKRDYPALAASRYGGDAAAALIGSGRVALFLDGLDEMPARLRVAAIRRLNTEAPGLRIGATSRPAEYEEAVGQVPLESAAVIELRPVRPAAAAKFLLQEQPARARTAWQRVAEYIIDDPGSPAAKALGNPLMLAMVRDVYATGDPRAIIDPVAFPTEDTIVTHLTDQFLARRYPGQRARHWLGCLARHLNDPGGHGPRDLEWWQLGRMLHPATRILAVIVATSVAASLVCLLVETPTLLAAKLPGSLASLPASGRFVLPLISSLLIGPVAGTIIFGPAYAIMVISGKEKLGSPQIPLRVRGLRTTARALGRRKHAVRAAAAGCLGGLIGGTVYGMLGALIEQLHYGTRVPRVDTFTIVIYTGITFGLAAGISLFVINALEEPSDTGAASTPLSLLAESRSRALLQTAILAPLPAIILAISWRAINSVQGLQGLTGWPFLAVLAVGGALGVVGMISYTLAFTAWGQWLLMARLVLPLTGRLPWRLTTFLQNAYDQGVLRQAGAVYQFRHLTLQTHLSQSRLLGAERRGRTGADG